MNILRNKVMRGRLPTPMKKSVAKAHTEQTGVFLSEAVQMLNHFLNETTLTSLKAEEPRQEAYYREVLSNLRKLAVCCEEGLDTCQIMLQQKPFQDAAAERVLYQIYHRCVEEFFSPKKDTWYEDSRALYTGGNAICFHEPIPATLEKLMVSLATYYQSMRENLEYYGANFQMM
ncbi:DUF3907 family protein [Bacillus sp. CLL-3-40]|nr:DUF3907 family protein [Bacillus changyiensis]